MSELTGTGGGGGASGAMTLIQSKVLSAPASPITFSAIPGTYNHLLIQGVLKTTSVNAADNGLLQINGDVGGDYYTVGSTTAGAVAPANKSSTAATSLAFTIAGNAGPTNQSSVTRIFIPDYAQTTFNKIMEIFSGFITTCDDLIGFWNSTAAIVSLSFTNSAAVNFATGSALYLYGIT